MSDWFLKKIWKKIKDPSWPDIDYWDDFLKIDERIQKECLEVFKIDQELNRFYDPEHWNTHAHIDFYQCDKFVFTNVAKCGYVHHRDFFLTRLKWEKKDYSEIKDQKDLIYFGLIMNPMRRYLKGLTEFIWQQKIKNTVDIEKFMEYAIVPDIHSLPYSIFVRPDMHKIHWIPFSSMSATEVKQSMNALFQKYNVDLTIPIDHPIMHESSEEKLKIFYSLKDTWEKQYDTMYFVYLLHGPDMKFYNNLIQKFKPDWSHINTEKLVDKI